MTAFATRTEPVAGGRSETLRRDRDRFLAFAFSSADILVELDADYRIRYAAGATIALTGETETQMIGAPFIDLVAQSDRALVAELMRTLKPGMRLDPVRIRFDGPRGLPIPLMLSGYQLAEVGGAYYFTLRLGTAVTAEGQTLTMRRDPQTGLLDKESFAQVAKMQVRDSKDAGEQLSFTVMRLGDLTELRSKLDRDDQECLFTTVGACLKAESAGGDMAARLDESNYGIVHVPDANIVELRSRITEYLKSLDPAGKGVAIEAATIGDAATVMDGADGTRTLIYTLNRICETALNGTTEEAATRIEDLVRDASERVVAFRRIVARDEVQLAFQPVVEVTSRKIRHYEALARFSSVITASPYDTITFAENVGLICDFDFTMCRRVLQWLEERRADRPNRRYTIAVNMSGRSVGNSAFLDSLHDLFRKHEDVRSNLMIELTESARIRDLGVCNRFIQSLREAGHIVCLDDFGTGAAALAYLHALDVDIVKIAGQYVQGAVQNKKYRATLKAMASLCSELGILTVAEMVEDASYLPVLVECGIPLGQGYLFGRPSFDIVDFDPVKPRWRG
jgi:EAL domain-containing protein (putative c-di-GMP-specific phosphodiesterase class I)/PAS domain-containing protein